MASLHATCCSPRRTCVQLLTVFVRSLSPSEDDKRNLDCTCIAASGKHVALMGNKVFDDLPISIEALIDTFNPNVVVLDK